MENKKLSTSANIDISDTLTITITIYTVNTKKNSRPIAIFQNIYVIVIEYIEVACVDVNKCRALFSI